MIPMLQENLTESSLMSSLKLIMDGVFCTGEGTMEEEKKIPGMTDGFSLIS